MRRLTEDALDALSDSQSRLRRRAPVLAILVSLFIIGIIITPAAYAASPFGKAVLFLDSVGSRLVSFRNTSLSFVPQKSEAEENTETSAQTDAEAEASRTENAGESGADNKVESKEIARYVVEEGDTVSRIAEDFHISQATLLSSNGLTSRSTLRIGQELKILPVDGVEHTVVRGETVSRIAQLHDADVDEIITFNNIESEGLIKPGQKIIVPGGKTTVPATASLAVQKKPDSGGTVSPVPVNSPKTAIDATGYFIFPVTGKITQGLHFLNAVDMGGSAYCGTPVKAAAGGAVTTVANSGWNGGYGNYIKIAHPNGTETIYAHNARNIVVLGQEVAQGEVIAYMGRSGNTTGCHVHFAVRGASNPFAR